MEKVISGKIADARFGISPDLAIRREREGKVFRPAE